MYDRVLIKIKTGDQPWEYIICTRVEANEIECDINHSNDEKEYYGRLEQPYRELYKISEGDLVNVSQGIQRQIIAQYHFDSWGESL